MQYPLVVILLEQSGYKKRKPRLEREAELLNLLREAIHVCKNHGQPITQEKLSNMVGVGGAALRRYPQVGELMTQAASQDKQERHERRFQLRQEELSQQVVVALQQLRDQNRRITRKAVGKLVHVSNICSYLSQSQNPRRERHSGTRYRSRNVCRLTDISKLIETDRHSCFCRLIFNLMAAPLQ